MMTGEGKLPTVREIYSRKKKNSSLRGDQTADSYFSACISKQYPTSRTDRMVKGALGVA